MEPYKAFEKMVKRMETDGAGISKNVALVDDEPACLELLRERITCLFPNLHIVFEACSLKEARTHLKNHDIDLVFLDVELTDGNGFDLLGNISAQTRVIFTTGHNEYAVRAFDVNALDYIVKPVEDDRLKQAVEMFSDDAKRNQTHLPTRATDPILLKEDGNSKLVSAEEILMVQSQKDYTNAVTQPKRWFMRKSMAEWEQLLPATLFLRIHRSTIINISAIERIKKVPVGKYRIWIKGIDDPISASRRYSERLRHLINQNPELGHLLSQ